MSRDVAVVRVATVTCASTTDDETRRAFWELRNLVAAARSVIDAAVHREESRSAHYRTDFPETNPVLDGQPSLRAADGSFRYGALDELYASKAR